jgi:hypothetical protein
MSKIIICRAKVNDDCLDATELEGDNHVEEDGTYDGESIVCDSCYISIMPFSKSGQALTDEIDSAIHSYLSNRRYVEKHDELDALLKEAEKGREESRVGSPRYASANAAVNMVWQEKERREKSASLKID